MPRKRPVWYRTGFHTGGHFDWEGEAWYRGYSSVKEMLEDLYVTKGYSTVKIANMFVAVSVNSVQRKLKRLGIRRVPIHVYRYQRKFPRFKELILRGYSLRYCLRQIGYSSYSSLNTTGFLKWVKEEKGLVNRGTNRHPKWVFTKGVGDDAGRD